MFTCSWAASFRLVVSTTDIEQVGVTKCSTTCRHLQYNHATHIQIFISWTLHLHIRTQMAPFTRHWGQICSSPVLYRIMTQHPLTTCSVWIWAVCAWVKMNFSVRVHGDDSDAAEERGYERVDKWVGKTCEGSPPPLLGGLTAGLSGSGLVSVGTKRIIVVNRIIFYG